MLSWMFHEAYMPHGYCLLWKPWLITLHAGSDFVIAASYFAIPAAIWIFVRKRPDLAMKKLAWMFAAFILFCGLTHVYAITVLWVGNYESEGVVKALTAVVSLATAIVIFPLIPKAVAIPSPSALQAANEQLGNEIEAHKRTLADLETARLNLEKRVAERTAELAEARDRFRAVQQTTPDGFMVFQSIRNASGQITDFEWLFINPASEAYVGRSADELMGRHLLEELPGNARTGLFDAYVDVVESGATWQEEVLYQHDGIDAWFRITAAKVGDGFAVSFADISEGKKAEEELRESREFLAQITRLVPTFLYIYDLKNDQVIWSNRELRKLLGNAAVDQTLQQSGGFLSLLEEEDAARYAAHIKELEGMGPDDMAEFEFHAPRYDGCQRWLNSQEMAYARSADGHITQVLGAVHDITERIEREGQIRLLMAEVNHRAKNLLTVVQSIARQTASDTDPKDFAETLSQRLQGLASSHDLIIGGNWQGVGLRDLVVSQLQPLVPDLDARVGISGPRVKVSPAAAQGIGMALHELTTNAIKHGALSMPDGRVSISWQFVKDGDERLLTLQWDERDGPPASPPRRHGFGYTVITRMAGHAMDGEIDLTFEPEGLSWRLVAPFERVVFEDGYTGDEA